MGALEHDISDLLGEGPAEGVAAVEPVCEGLQPLEAPKPYPVDRTPAIPTTCPAGLAALKAWLYWKYGPDKWGKNGKPDRPDKIPFYTEADTDGKAKLRGKNGSPEDRASLVPFDEAVAAAEASRNPGGAQYTGVGLAMFKDWGVVAGDFDNCIDEDGNVLPEVLALVAGTYAEISPSGTGIRAFWTGYLPLLADSKDKTRWPFGFEVFTDNKWVTFTGNKLPGHAPRPDA